jgi:hypothetical protein
VGNTSGNTGTVEAIFGYKPAVRPGIPPSGAAMYFYGGVSFNNNANLIVSAGGPPAIQVKVGDVTCSNGTIIQGDVVVANGNLSINSCKIVGNAWVSGLATLGTISGNLSAGSATPMSPGPPPKPVGVSGTWTQNGAIPVAPDWTHFGYNPSSWSTMWVDATGTPFAVVPIGADCALSPTMLATVATKAPLSVVIDANSCTAGVTAPSDVSLPTDVAIYAPMYDLSRSNNLTFASSSATQPRKLWFITPDITNTNPPSCGATQGNFTINNRLIIDPSVSAMLYTPCKFDAKNTFTWVGQIYANGSSNSFKNNTGFTYVGLGLPGVNLSDPSNPPPPSSGSPADLKALNSLRDVN